MNLPDADNKAAVVEAMFDRIAPHYDLMNRLMTFGMDRAWRQQTVDAVGAAPGSRVLDLACGTGDLCTEALRTGHRVVGLDFSVRMLQAAAARRIGCRFIRADALRLPLRDSSLDAIVSGFALRNFTDLEGVFRECFRALRPGGRIALLEVDTPASVVLRFGHRIYFHKLVPLMGRLIDRDAYAYLPSSICYLPDEASMMAMLRAAGFSGLGKRRLLGGSVQLVTAQRQFQRI